MSDNLVTENELWYAPDPKAEVTAGLLWGKVDAFPTPAYWAYQVRSHFDGSDCSPHRLTNSLSEEVCACLLGGYGLPSAIGNAAFERLRASGALRAGATQSTIENILREPLVVNGRQARYRFAAQRARYVAAALSALSGEEAPQSTGKELRDRLLMLPGIGYKTASWVARNWLDANDVAILDVHVLRAGYLTGFLNHKFTAERDYLLLEQQFLTFSSAIGARPADLDAVIWREMMASPRAVRQLLADRQPFANPGAFQSRQRPRRRAGDPLRGRAPSRPQ